MIGKGYAKLTDSSLERATAARPTVTDMGRAEVIPIGIHRENPLVKNDEKAENA